MTTASTDDERYMRRALELAARGRGWTSPNPMVGCVVARNGTTLSEGYHAKAGGAHAEVEALRQVDDVSEATVYVTLEPCAHRGKTPPCIDLLLAKRPKRVVAAMMDPNPQVNGRGVEALRAAGIEVEVGILEHEARRLNEVFVKYVTTGRPFVIAKCGMSLDGKIATASGNSKWITGDAARQFAHELRHSVDAVLVGRRTVERDDPRLNVRIPERESKNPIRIVLDTKGELTNETSMFQLDTKEETYVVTTKPNHTLKNVKVIQTPERDGHVDLAALMDELGRRDTTSVLIEGGGETLASAFEAGLVDKIMFFVAPKILGGREAVPAVGGRGAPTVADAVRLKDMTATPVGEDILIEAYVDHAARGDE